MAAPRKYPQEVRDRAVRMVEEARQDPERRHGALVRVAEQLGVNKETLLQLGQAGRLGDGRRPGVTTDQADELEIRLARLTAAGKGRLGRTLRASTPPGLAKVWATKRFGAEERRGPGAGRGSLSLRAATRPFGGR